MNNTTLEELMWFILGYNLIFIHVYFAGALQKVNAVKPSLKSPRGLNFMRRKARRDAYLEAIKKWPVPTTLSETRAFLGKVG
jgi:hypothetical protein